MKKFYKSLLVFSQSLFCLGLIGCSGNNDQPKQVYEDDSEDIPTSNAVKLKCDFKTPSDPALLKKVETYSAGCVNPITNFARDMQYIKMLNAHSTRIDTSIGKDNGNGGEFLVSDEYDIYDVNPEKDTYKVDKDSLGYDFSVLDNTFSYWKEMNSLPYASWTYIPAPLQKDQKFIKLETRVENWKEVFEEIYYNYAKHYVDNDIKIGYHEIYNEPDLEILKYWGVMDPSTFGFLDIDSFAPLQSDGVTRDPSKGCYPDFYEYGVKGILRADPDATVGGPAFALGEIGVADWIGFLPRVIKQNLPIDFYSFHSYFDGSTWYMTDEQRAKGKKNELETVVDGLSKNQHFLNTAVHINEFSVNNNETGAQAGENADINFYYGAPLVLDGIFEAVNRTSIQQINWSQLLSTSNVDTYGLIGYNGKPKATFNSVLMYQDMPIWRYTVNSSDDNSGLKSVVSSSDDKISILIWNENKARNEQGITTTDGDRVAAVSLDSPKFSGGTRKIYRIDKDHASSSNNTKTMLPSFQNKRTLTGEEEYAWCGNVPAQGVVYITINKNDVEDFKIDNTNQDFANMIKTSYWYEDRYRDLTGSREEYVDYVNGISGSYAMFDDHKWTTYLGLGDCLGKADGSYKDQAVASCSVLCDELPSSFKINLDSNVRAKMLNANSNLSVRIDFYDESKKMYTNSVTLHNGVFDKYATPMEQDSKLSSQADYPWGTKKLTDDEVKFSGNTWNVDLSQYAPSSWLNGSHKAMISYTMRNTGANSRCAFTLTK